MIRECARANLKKQLRSKDEHGWAAMNGADRSNGADQFIRAYTCDGSELGAGDSGESGANVWPDERGVLLPSVLTAAAVLPNEKIGGTMLLAGVLIVAETVASLTASQSNSIAKRRESPDNSPSMLEIESQMMPTTRLCTIQSCLPRGDSKTDPGRPSAQEGRGGGTQDGWAGQKRGGGGVGWGWGVGGWGAGVGCAGPSML